MTSVLHQNAFTSRILEPSLQGLMSSTKYIDLIMAIFIHHVFSTSTRFVTYLVTSGKWNYALWWYGLSSFFREGYFLAKNQHTWKKILYSKSLSYTILSCTGLAGERFLIGSKNLWDTYHISANSFRGNYSFLN